KVVGGSGESAIRALLQGIRRGMEFGLLIRNVVLRADARSARVEVVQLPFGDLAVGVDGTGNVDYACRTEVRPSELFFPRPDQANGFPGGLGESRGLNGHL